MSYPNGQASVYSYYGNLGDRRLQTIHHRYPGGATLSKFDYTYDSVGNILTWRQQADSANPVDWRYSYDANDQLLTAAQWTTAATPAVLKRYAYTYDLVGNRISEQIDDAVTLSGYDGLNRLQSQSAGGPVRVAGTVNEFATVTIQGRPAMVAGDNTFTGTVSLIPGTNTFAVTAIDAAGNARTQTYAVDATGSARTFTYDANGNLTADGARTFEWDARNQLVAVNVGTHRSEFAYDGERRRVRMIEKENGVTQSDTKVVWFDQEICEERAADGTTITRRIFERAEQVAGAARLLVSDHLGSIDAFTDDTGAVLTRYAFDPWGRRTVTAGSDGTSAGYTGHQWQSASSVFLALYRAYDPALGRWLSEDPAGRADGLNLALYVRGNPVTYRDELGLLKTVGFPADKQKDVEEAVKAIREKLNCGNCAGPDTDRLKEVVDNPGMTIKYSPKLEDCGQTGPMTVLKINRTFAIGPKAWNCCGNIDDPKVSLASTILHEFAHRGDAGEKRPYEIEDSCFGCRRQ